jgi:hypothetical protein
MDDREVAFPNQAFFQEGRCAPRGFPPRRREEEAGGLSIQAGYDMELRVSLEHEAPQGGVEESTGGMDR